MSPNKVVEVVNTYVKLLEDIGAVASRNEEPEVLLDVSTAKHHLLWMCVEAQAIVDQGRLEKAMRWLGFIQGGLWALRLRTLEDLKSDNMPEGVYFDKDRV
jgi:hypothetical protein